MSHKQGQESHTNYMDGIKVKISEQYKPPRRINLAISYSQRLTLNKQIQDNIPNYDFMLEESVKSKMNEWRNARHVLAEEKRERFEKCKEERRLREEERLKKEKEFQNKIEDQEVNKIDNITGVHNSSYTCLVSKQDSSQNYISNTSTASMLFPTQVTTSPYSNILMPTQLPNIPNCQSYNAPKNNDKSPFNISDFEADTSSPFDNMELKTINDMEELAQVLKNDDSAHKNQNAYSYNTQPNQYYRSLQDPMSAYTTYTNPQVSGIPKPSYIQPMSYSGTNGYYCPSDNLFKNSPYTIPYVNKDSDLNKRIPMPSSTLGNDGRSSCTPVQDIIKSLQTDLNNTHIDKNIENQQCKISIGAKGFNSGSKASSATSQKTIEELDDPFNTLSSDMQQLSRNISSMGFPLPRVARACKLIGNDHKKIVEHLLAMNELLDLGFSEMQVSSALLQCNNNRDKALDVLIL